MATVFEGVTYDDRHGGPFDRGAADSYYRRAMAPHYYVGATAQSERITTEQMTNDQLAEYLAGYEWNEQFGDKKDYD